ncbi:MAG: response regulator transcription factor [Clostridiales bacterium]|nr:response regulator transcription factor [Clostridiales bacterium]
MAKILIVDDEKGIREVIREYAEFNGYEVTEATDGMQAVAICQKEEFDLIVMDIMMPRLDGFSAVKEIKKSRDIPVIMLSARSEEYDKLFAFEVGVDDYMVKPFSPKELMARAQAILNRARPQENLNEQLAEGGIEIDLPAREVNIDGARIELTPKEYDLLVYFIQNKNVALSRDIILADIWGYDFGDVRTIDTHVKNLRGALGPYRGKIVTLRGVGYKFEG